MPVPTYEAFMLPLLRQLADGAEHQVRDVRERLATEFKLTPADRAERLPSGKQSYFDNRVGWAKTYLEKAGLATSVRRGVYRITDLGKKVLADKPKDIDKDYLEKFESFRSFLETRDEGIAEKTEGSVPAVTPESSTPEEQLESAHKKLRKKVEVEVLEAVRAASPQFFEKLVVELLVKMGYGGSLADAGEALGRTGDGGIDGVIKEDHLGLDAIYVQAKRWTTDKNVGRPEVQGFAGSLLGRRGRKGVFITTSGFSSEAREYVTQIESKIVLIDGPTLAALMVDKGVGVTTVSSFDVKRVDTDYFSEE